MINPLSLLPTEQQTVVLLPRSSSASKTYLPIPVDHLEEEYRLRSADDGKLFREEYNVSRPTSIFLFFFLEVRLAVVNGSHKAVLCGLNNQSDAYIRHVRQGYYGAFMCICRSVEILVHFFPFLNTLQVPPHL